MTDKGTLYSPGTINGINMACERLKKFEASKKHIYDFDEIDMNFYREYTAYLNKQGYAINTTGKCIKQLKAIMALAESEGYHNNHIYASKKFKGTRVEVDSIYLTKEDLDKIRAVDLSKRTYGFDLARDIFFVGIWTAQRVSDYNNIHKDDIETYQMRSIVDVPDPENPGKTIAKIETIWATQKAMAELFGVTKQTISYHLINIFKSGELNPDTVVKEILITVQGGVRGLSEDKIKYYNLDAIISWKYRSLLTPRPK